MNEHQFDILIQELQIQKNEIIGKLEEIRIAFIDVENKIIKAQGIKSDLTEDIKDGKQFGALPRWRCKSCRRLYREYDNAVNCCG